MSVALLIITHAPLGTAMMEAATTMLCNLPLPVTVLDIAPDADPAQERQLALQKLEEIDNGDGILVMTDLYGSTPSNIACHLLESGHHLRLLSGLSLPMLIRTLNYPNLPLAELAAKAESGGHDGIVAKTDVASMERINHA